jgi:hypothetical protein
MGSSAQARALVPSIPATAQDETIEGRNFDMMVFLSVAEDESGRVVSSSGPGVAATTLPAGIALVSRVAAGIAARGVG